MRKSNWIILAVLASASAFFLWLWYYLNFSLVDNPVDLAFTIVWWAAIIAGCVGIHLAAPDLGGNLLPQLLRRVQVFLVKGQGILVLFSSFQIVFQPPDHHQHLLHPLQLVGGEAVAFVSGHENFPDFA